VLRPACPNGRRRRTPWCCPRTEDRLGLLVKLEMMDALARQAPQVRRVITGNAGQNEHMIAINEQLGYTISSITRTWELEAG
jgi:hypothetical protein